jgi:hypothetical protein
MNWDVYGLSESVIFSKGCLNLLSICAQTQFYSEDSNKNVSDFLKAFIILSTFYVSD